MSTTTNKNNSSTMSKINKHDNQKLSTISYSNLNNKSICNSSSNSASSNNWMTQKKKKSLQLVIHELRPTSFFQKESA